MESGDSLLEIVRRDHAEEAAREAAEDEAEKAKHGDDAFIKVFYEKLGTAYMEKHKAGLRTFLTSIRQVVSSHLKRVDDARKVFEGKG